MGQCPDGNEVYPTLGIIAQSVESDTAARLRFKTSGHHLHGLTRILHGEVVEHDTVYAAHIQHLLQFIEVTHFDFYLQVLSLFLEILMATVDGVGDASGEVYVVVLQENHVE